MTAEGGGPQVKRLVTFLGTGNYNETVYRFEGKEAQKTPYVCRSLAEIFRPSDIAVLATVEAEQCHWSALQDALRSGNCPAPRLVHIPAGREPAELWQQFEIIKAELRGSAGPVVLDITHGFRSQPFFAAAVAAFVHAVDENPPELRVCYAAYEARDPKTGVAPIWELTEFVALLDWSRALGTFLRTGRAKDAGTATEHLGRDLKKAWFQAGKPGMEPTLRVLGESLVRFGADLETLRTGDLLIGNGGAKSSAVRLLETAQRAREHAAQHAPPLADILDRVVAMAEPLVGASGDLSGDQGRKAVTELAELYLRLGRYLEAAATVREGWVNFYSARAALCPGAATFDKPERDRAEQRAHTCDGTFREVTDRRNDFLHAQYRPAAQDSAGVVATVQNLVEKLRNATETGRGACFVNLTNHSSAAWEQTQTNAALALAERIEDIPFPAVSPDIGETEVKALAEGLVGQMPRTATHALIQGEFTLTVELVRRLQARNIICLAATSTRDVEERADGRKVSTFRFVRFRAYPQSQAQSPRGSAE
jgi:CRISPR-associated protein Csx16